MLLNTNVSAQTISAQGQKGWSSQPHSAAINERAILRPLIIIALLGLVAGLVAYTKVQTPLAHWSGATPVARTTVSKNDWVKGH